MKKTIPLLFFAAFFVHFSCTTPKEQISVRIDGWGNDTVIVRYYDISSEQEGGDTLLARNGRFDYTLPVEGLVQARFFRKADLYPRLPESRRIDVVTISGERLKIRGKARADLALEYTARGSQLMEDLGKIREQTLDDILQKDSNELVLNEIYGIDLEEEAKRFARRRELNAEIRTVERTYIRAHPDHLSSAIFVLNQPLDSLPAYYTLLTEEVKNGVFKPLLDASMQDYAEYQEYLKNKERESIGQPAPDFTLTGIDGGPFTLSEYDTQGKYTVLDFWGSWCGPCIAGIPEMKKQYEQYRDRLEIIGIACNDKEAAWKAAVAENGLPWIQLINDETSVESNVAVRYAVAAYPTKIILSPDKTILFTFVGEGEDFYQKLDELLK